MKATKNQYKDLQLDVKLSWDNAAQKAEFDKHIASFWTVGDTFLNSGTGGGLEQSHAINYVLLKIWQLADKKFYTDKSKPELERWQLKLLRHFLALGLADKDWWALSPEKGVGIPSGIIDITINYTWNPLIGSVKDSTVNLKSIYSDQKIPTDYDMTLNPFGTVEDGYDYNSQYDWHDRIGVTSAGLTGDGMVEKILEALPEIMQRYPEILMDNPLIARVITSNYSYNDTQEVMVTRINEIIKNMATGDLSLEVSLTDDVFSASGPFLHSELARWGLGVGSGGGDMKDGDVGSNLFASNTLKEVTIPALFFQSADAVAMTAEQVEADSTISDMFLKKIRYNDWTTDDAGTVIINPGLYSARVDDGGAEVLDRDIWAGFMNRLQTTPGIPTDTKLVDWQPRTANIDYGWDGDIEELGKSLYESLWNNTIGAVWNWAFGEGQEIKDETFDEIKKYAARVFNLTYTAFVLDVMEQGKKHAQGGPAYNVRVLWEKYFTVEVGSESWNAQNHPLWLLTQMVLVDKELGRRTGKWSKLAEKANACLTREDGSEDCSDLQYRDLNGQLEKYDPVAGGWNADDVSELEAEIGAGSADGFANDEEQKKQETPDDLTDEEIEDRKKTYKQCALMLNAHTLKKQLVSDLRNQYNSNTGDPLNLPFRGRFYMAKCHTDQERLIGNLVASPAGAAFFTLPPAVMTYLRPKLRLFKVENNTGGELLDTEFIFGRYTDLDRKENYIKKQSTFMDSPFDKGSGCGVKEFSWEFNGTNPATARNDIKAKLTLFFQSFNDFVKARLASNGKEYRFVDLVIQPKPDGNKINNVEIVSTNQYDPSFYRIRAEVGYYLPDSDIPFSKQYGRSIYPAIKQTNRSFYLCMVDHTIDVNNDGTVTIEISYRAYVETALKSYRFDALSTPELQQKRKESQNTLAKMVKENCNKKDIRDYKVAIEAMEEELRKASLQSIIRRLLQRDKIYIVKLEDAHKNFFFRNGYFEEAKLIPISEAVPAKEESPSPAEKLGSVDTPEGGELEKVLLESQIPEEGFDFTDMQNTTIQFFFFGDLLDVISDTLYEKDGITPVAAMENTKYILGSFDFDAYLGDTGKSDSVMNIAQIPLAVDFFSNWFADNVISQGETRKSFPIIEFIRNLSNSALAQSLLESCVNRKIKKTLRFTTGQISAYSKTQPPSDPMKEAWEASGEMIMYTDNNPYLPLLGDSEQEGKTKSKGFYNYITLNVLGSSLTYTGNGDYLEDINKGRYHINIGSRAGIVKTVSFEKPDIMYIREARFMQQGVNGLLQLSAVYNVNIEMFGNTLFYPGMEVFVNPFGMGGTALGSPTQGAGSVGGRSMANILGLGGYHTITHVNSSIGVSGFKTSVKALQYYSGDGSGNPNLVQGGTNIDLESISDTQEPEGKEAKEFCEGALANLAATWDAGLDGTYLEHKEAPPINKPPPGGGGSGGSGGGGDHVPAPAPQNIPPPARGPNTFTFEYNEDSLSEERTGEQVTFEYDKIEKRTMLNTLEDEGMSFFLNEVKVAELNKIKANISRYGVRAQLILYNNGTKTGTYSSYQVGRSFPTMEELEINDTDLSPEDTQEAKAWDVEGSTEEQQPPAPEAFPDMEAGGGLELDTDALNSESVSPNLMLIMGDSQSTYSSGAGGTLGYHTGQYYKEIGAKVEYVGKHSLQVKRFLSGEYHTKLVKVLKEYPADIIIFLGGNGATTSDATKLINLIYEHCPLSRVDWVLPPPPGASGQYANKEGQYHKRRMYGTEIIDGVGMSSMNISMYDPYTADGWEEKINDKGFKYGNPYPGDGVHVKGDAALDLLKQFDLID